MKVYIIWLIGIITWNFGVPDAAPIEDVIFAASTIWNDSLIIFQTYSWIIGAVISALTYYLLTSK